MTEKDWTDDPEVEKWFESIRVHMLPKLKASFANLTIVPEDVDPKFAVELGYSIMLDKPIVLIVRPGVSVPDKLSQIADGIIEWNDDGETMAVHVKETIERIAKSRGM